MSDDRCYRWVIVSLCFLMVFTCLGFCSSTKSLFVSAVTDATGISRTAFSLNDTCRFISTSVVNIFFGFLVERFGVKKLIGAGFGALTLSFLTYSVANSTWMFCLGGCLLGTGLSWTTTTMVGCIVNRWWKERKGTVMGVILAANGVGGALATQIVSPIIYRADGTYGYKQAYFLIATVLFCVGLLVVLLFREAPQKTESVQMTPKKRRGQTWDGMAYEEAVKKVYFYGAAICIFLTGFVLQGITGIAAVHLKDMGLTAAFVATVVSVHSLSLTAFKFLTGFLYDHFGLRITSTACSVAGIAVMTALLFVTDSATGKCLALFYGVFSAMALPLETIMLPIFAGDLFGEKSFNRVLGIFVSVNTAGYALSSPLFNLCSDLFGDYRIPLISSALIMVAVVCVMQIVISASHRERKKRESRV